jgi:cell division protease FtsH
MKNPSSELVSKMKLLNDVKEQLKCEYAGIDRVIDEFMTAVCPWFIFPDLQDRPVVVNLWGLTGTGKSSLVKRFTELIQMQHYFHFDLGEVNDNKLSIRNQLEDIHEYRNGLPLIIGLDEFQHARSINENGEELISAPLRIVWDLLDSGEFQLIRYEVHFSYEIIEFIKAFRIALNRGIVVKNGKVVQGIDVFDKCMDENWSSYKKTARSRSKSTVSKEKNLFQDDFIESLYDVTKHLFENRISFIDQLFSFDGPDTIIYLERVYEGLFRPVTVNCTKALIIVMGNLDEAYQMSSNYNPDMSADEFHRQSLQINITHIKKVLRKRFRNEQIARLGNIHIIYPALNEASFRKIIQMELNKIRNNYVKKLDLNFIFDESIEEILYREGVYPSQGTRPLFSTIYQVVNAHISRIELFRQEQCPESKTVHVKYNESGLQFLFHKRKNIVHTLTIQPTLNLEVLRKEKKDDVQALVAVHESGHAALMMLLFHKLPDNVFSNSLDGEMDGFVINKQDESTIYSRVWLKKQVAVFLGGLCAERIVFGDSGLTLGSENDIKQATSLVLHALKSAGFSDVPVRFGIESVEHNYTITSSTLELEKQAQIIIQEAEQLAIEYLTRNKQFLMQLSLHLSESRNITQEVLRELFLRYACENQDEIWFDMPLDENQYKKKLLDALNGYSNEVLQIDDNVQVDSYRNWENKSNVA